MFNLQITFRGTHLYHDSINSALCIKREKINELAKKQHGKLKNDNTFDFEDEEELMKFWYEFVEL